MIPCKACGLPAHPMTTCGVAKRLAASKPVVHAVVHKAEVVHIEPAVVVHKESRAGKYKDAEARKAYRREWMRAKRHEQKV